MPRAERKHAKTVRLSRRKHVDHRRATAPCSRKFSRLPRDLAVASKVARGQVVRVVEGRLGAQARELGPSAAEARGLPLAVLELLLQRPLRRQALRAGGVVHEPLQVPQEHQE